MCLAHFCQSKKALHFAISENASLSLKCDHIGVGPAEQGQGELVPSKNLAILRALSDFLTFFRPWVVTTILERDENGFEFHAVTHFILFKSSDRLSPREKRRRKLFDIGCAMAFFLFLSQFLTKF